MKILVINGPNLNFLGIREPSVYGKQDYNYLVNMIEEKCRECGCEVECFQSNHEGAIIDRIQESYFDKTTKSRQMMKFPLNNIQDTNF